MLDTIVVQGIALNVFSPPWDAIKFTLKVGIQFICIFVVIDPTYSA